MKANVQKKVIESILVKSIPFVNQKDNSQITSNINIICIDGKMKVSATDYEIGIFSNTDDLMIIDDGQIIANGKKILDVIKILKNGEVSIETKSNILHISQGRSRFKIPLLETEDFPKFPTIENKSKLTINSTKMINSFREVMPAIDVNNPKFELNGVLMDISDNISFVSTNTKVLSIASIPNDSETKATMIIPRKAISEIQKLFFDDINIYYDESYLMIESDNFSFFTKLINGKFPQFERIIPKETIYNLTLNKVLIIDTIKQINTISIDIKILIKSDKIIFESISQDSSESKIELEIDTKIDEEIELCLNSKYMLDFLNVIYDSEFNIGINEGTMPIVLSSETLKTIAMPIVP